MGREDQEAPNYTETESQPASIPHVKDSLPPS